MVSEKTLNEGFEKNLLHSAQALARQIPQQLEDEVRRGLRRRVRGVCIDGPDSLDRDDAIWMELDERGNLVVEVSITDVSAMVEKDSALDRQARERFQSTYRAKSVQHPMFPAVLSWDDRPEYGQLVLSESGDRPTVTTRMVLDPTTGVALHAEIFNSVLHAQIAAYDSLYEQDGSKPPTVPGTKAEMEQANDGPERYRTWLHFATVLGQAREREPEAILPYEIERDGQITMLNEEGEALQLSAREASVHKLVMEPMLLANRMGARLARRAAIPSLYRVQQAELAGDPWQRKFDRKSDLREAREAMRSSGQLRGGALEMKELWAGYAHQPTPHLTLGFRYAHLTSPIRRYPDVVSQRMQHWLINANDTLADGLAEASGKPRGEVLHALWQSQILEPEQLNRQTLRGDRLAQHLCYLRQADNGAQQKRVAPLQGHVVEALELLSPGSGDKAPALVEQWRTDPLLAVPYRREEMVLLAQEMTDKGYAQRHGASLDLFSQGTEAQLQKMDAEALMLLKQADPKNPDAAMIGEAINDMASLTKPRFSALLQQAAKSGQAGRIPIQIVEERFRNRQLQETIDLPVIFGALKLPDDSQPEARHHWLALKDEVIARRFSQNPAHAKAFFSHLQERYGWQLHTSTTVLVEDNKAGRGPIAAVVSLQRKRDKKPEVPAIFSVGFWGKSTRHHARIEFLRGLAHEELCTDQPRLPTALEWMIYDADHQRPYGQEFYDFIQESGARHGLNLDERILYPAGHELRVRFTNHNGEARQLDFVAQHASPEWSRHEVYRQFLLTHASRPVQADIFRAHEKLEMVPLDADEAVDKILDHLRKHGGEGANAIYLERTESAPNHNKRDELARQIWKAGAVLHLGESHSSKTFSAESTQREVAATLCNEQVLEYLMQVAQQAEEHGLRSPFKQPLRAYLSSLRHSFREHVVDGEPTPADETPFSARIEPRQHWRVIAAAHKLSAQAPVQGR